jgi:hypothetical protein
MTDVQADAGRVGEHVEDVALGPAAPASGAAAGGGAGLVTVTLHRTAPLAMGVWCVVLGVGKGWDAMRAWTFRGPEPGPDMEKLFPSCSGGLGRPRLRRWLLRPATPAGPPMDTRPRQVADNGPWQLRVDNVEIVTIMDAWFSALAVYRSGSARFPPTRNAGEAVPPGARLPGADLESGRGRRGP